MRLEIGYLGHVSQMLQAISCEDDLSHHHHGIHLGSLHGRHARFSGWPASSSVVETFVYCGCPSHLGRLCRCGLTRSHSLSCSHGAFNPS